MNPYDRYFLPYLIDWTCGSRIFDRQRQKVIPQARGRVLEVGLGTGRNLRHYDSTQLEAFHGLEPSLHMHHLADKRARRVGLEIQTLALSAEEIPMPDASFDTVVTTFTLCTIPDPVKALKEMWRVLSPGGQLLYAEHGLAPDARVQRWQHRTTTWWKHISGGCHLDRDIPALLDAGGFSIRSGQAAYLSGPKVFMYNYWGVAGRA